MMMAFVFGDAEFEIERVHAPALESRAALL
jgi:hypothetical protein